MKPICLRLFLILLAVMVCSLPLSAQNARNDPNEESPNFSILRQRVLQQTNEETLAEYREAVSRLPTAEARYRQWNALADALAPYSSNGYAFAHALRAALAELEPYDHRYWPAMDRLLGFTAGTLRRPGEAVDILRQHIGDLRVGHGDPRAWVWLADIESQMGHRESAREMMSVLMNTIGPQQAELHQRINIIEDFLEDDTKDRAGFKQNLEASQLMQQVQARLEEGNWAEGDALLVQLLENWPDILIRSAGEGGAGPRRALETMIRNLPARTRADYGEFLEREAARVLEKGDAGSLRRFDFQHPWLPQRGQVRLALAEALANDGRHRLALHHFASAHALLTDTAARRRAEVGAARTAAEAGLPVPDFAGLSQPVTVAGEEMPLARAVEEWQSPGRDTTPVAPVSLGDLNAARLRLHQAPLSLYKWMAGFQHKFWEEGPNMLSEFIPYFPAGDRDSVFVNTSEMLYALDPVEGRLLWSRQPGQMFTADVLPPSLEEINLRNVPKQFYVGLSAEAVYYRFSWSGRATGEMHSALYASDRETGALLWSTQNLPELQGLRFITDPACAGGVVVAGAWEPRDIPVFYLVGLDAVTGELLYKTWLYSGTMFPSLQWEKGRQMLDVPLSVPPPLVHDGAVFFGPSTGYLSRVDLYAGQVEWIRSYPRRTTYGPSEWAGEFYFNRPSAAPVVAGDTLLFAPRDFRGVFFMDPATGDRRRQYEHTGFRALVGADAERVYIQQDGAIAALRLEDASLVWRRDLPANIIVGRPTLSERGLLCSTNNGHYLLDSKTGNILSHQPLEGWQNNGNALDLGDRIITASINALFIYSREGGLVENWQLPQAPGAEPLRAEVPDPGGLLRWTLPAPDRNDFYLDYNAPGLLAIRALESFELRRTDPAPSLLMVWPDFQWPRHIRFNENVFVLDYNDGQIVGVDPATGRQLWRHQSGAMDGDRSEGGTIVFGDSVVWHGRKELRVLETRSGETRWDRDYDARIRGVSPAGDRLAVFVEDDDACRAFVHDGKTGQILHDIRLTEPGRQNVRMVCARKPGEWVTACEPAFFLETGQAGWIDPETGRLFKNSVGGMGVGQALVLSGGVLYQLDHRGYLTAAVSYPELGPLKYQERTFVVFDNNYQYYTDNLYWVRQDLETGDREWIVSADGWRTNAFVKNGPWLLAAQSENVPEGQESQRTRFMVMNASDGKIVQEIPGLGRSFGKAVGHNGLIFVHDGGYLYCFGPPEETGHEAVTIEQKQADPMAVAALKLARDEERARLEPLPVESGPRAVDGELDDWSEARWHSLGWPNNWIPDHALLDPKRRRYPAGEDDIHARVALSRDDTTFYIAIDVTDDRHDADPHRPLWRGDSVELLWRAAGPEARELRLALACVQGVPVLEQGPQDAPERVLAEMGAWPAWLRASAEAGSVGWLEDYRAEASPLDSVHFVARRLAGRTIYELALPHSLLHGLGALNESGDLLWDLRVNDADGTGREGALEIGSGFLQYERPIGFVAWPHAGRTASEGRRLGAATE